MIYAANNMPKYDPGDLVGSYRKLWNFCYALSEQLMLLLNNLGEDNIPELESIYNRLESAEGGYSELVQTADAIEARVTDGERALAEVQLTAEGLSSRVQDTEKGVSQLQQTAEGIGSRVANNEGAISTLQQTAAGIQTQVGDMQGNITTLQQTASGLTTRISNAEGAISTVQQTANGLQSTVSDLEGDYSSLKQTVDGFDIEGEVNMILEDGISTELNFNYRNTSYGCIYADRNTLNVDSSGTLQMSGDDIAMVTYSGGMISLASEGIYLDSSDEIGFDAGDEGTKIWVSGTRYWTFGRSGIFYCNKYGEHLSEVVLA